MLKNTTFCESCRRDMSYTVETKQHEGQLNGHHFVYDSPMAICQECHAEVFVHEVEDEDLRLLYEAFGNRNGIISIDTDLPTPEK